MELTLLAIIILFFGVLLAFVGYKRRTVKADRGGVAVGGNNKGTIQTGKAKRSNALIIIGLVLQFIGVSVALYDAFYLGSHQ